jgi:hypothetical protein
VRAAEKKIEKALFINFFFQLLSQTARMPTVASCQAAVRAAAAKSLDSNHRLPVGIPINPIQQGPTASNTSTNVMMVSSSTGLPVTSRAPQPVQNKSLPGAAKDLIDLTMEDDIGGPKQVAKVMTDFLMSFNIHI